MLLDALVQLTVESRTLTAPPGSPAEGACYIPATVATGAWSGWDGQIAVYSGGWFRIVPVSGLKAWVKAERLDRHLRRRRLARRHRAHRPWRPRHAARQGRRARRSTGAYVETADAAFIPDRAIVLGVSSRTTLAVTGATSYGVGISGDATKFGNLLGIALNSTNIGVIGPTGFYADTKVRVTANGGNFTAGKVRLAVYFLEMSSA